MDTLSLAAATLTSPPVVRRQLMQTEEAGTTPVRVVRPGTYA